MEGLERGPVLAKQVLSQLSYTPVELYDSKRFSVGVTTLCLGRCSIRNLYIKVDENQKIAHRKGRSSCYVRVPESSIQVALEVIL